MRTMTLLFFLCVAVSGTFGEVTEIEPADVYGQIDTSYDLQLIQALSGTDKEEVARALEEVFQNIDRVTPPVLFLVSNLVYELDGYTAALLFHIAQLRALIDAMLCADRTARQAVVILDMNFQPLITDYILENRDLAYESVRSAISYVLLNDVAYDRRWINLHGIQAFGSSSGGTGYLSIPQDQWESIISNTIEEYSEYIFSYLDQLEYRDSS